MWSWIFDTRQRPLADILEARDSHALARELAAMFQKTFVLGLAPGSLISHSDSRLGRRIWRIKTLDALVSLAEALAVLPVYDPEKGGSTSALESGLIEILQGIELTLGFSIGVPDVGAPYGLSINGRLVTVDSPEQIYVASRLDEGVRTYLGAGAANAVRIVEIGGGYGATCYWSLQRNTVVARYEIVDLPIVNVLQGYFLSLALGCDQVSLFGEEPSRVVLTPNTALDSIESPYDVLVNKDSMPEMPQETVLEYLRWARSTCDGIFFSCNQESAASFRGQSQGLIPDAVRETGGFRRLRRDESWVRRGYVEEVYALADSR